MRKKYVIGNWKMNKTYEEARECVTLFKELLDGKYKDNVKIVVCPPYTALSVVAYELQNTPIECGAQNVHYMPNGAYTGEISSDMLKDLGVTFCIVGHSERRQYFNETDTAVNKKIKILLENSITPVICVGETLEQRENAKANETVQCELYKAFENIDKKQIQNCVIAYEPIWAIGTGKTSPAEEAEKMCKFIRHIIKELYDVQTSENVHILYGGSVNLTNAKDILAMPNIDGALIGGASLKKDFVDIILTQE